MFSFPNDFASGYPINTRATRLLIVMLMTMATHAGNPSPKISGGGKKTHKYPPTTRPNGKEPKTHAARACLLNRYMTSAETRFAIGPKNTS